MGRLFVYGASVVSVILLSLIYAVLVSGGGGTPQPSGSVEPSSSVAASASPEPTVEPTPVPTPTPTAGPVVGDFEVHAFDFGFTPQTVNVPAPGRYRVTFVNDGAIGHNLTLADGTAISAGTGETATGDVVIPDGGTTFKCTVTGHAAAGMTGTVTVGGSGEASPSPSG